MQPIRYYNGCMEHETQSLTVRFPPELLKQMKESAKNNHRSLNGEILKALEDYLKQETKKKGK
ncbi:YlcI/YnfO family protein [Ktedonobacter sp. SOSP1-85]|uniref:YlcI/YnfO family protein n=1 Tax=Ktedonobacter sp. SOSP1-85 TaxID=2778367 RepID=UPI001915347F